MILWLVMIFMIHMLPLEKKRRAALVMLLTENLAKMRDRTLALIDSKQKFFHQITTTFNMFSLRGF